MHDNYCEPQLQPVYSADVATPGDQGADLVQPFEGIIESAHQEQVAAFVEGNRGEYHSVRVGDQDQGEAGAREAALQRCRDTRCDYLFVVDSTAHLDNQYTLMLLVEQVAALHII